MFYILYMHQTNVKNVDLNLLKALDALLETESVSKAAVLVNLSQPAMSRALNRLQHALKDPLLVRSGRGMVLTPRAEALRAPVREALAQVSSVFTPKVFDPAKAQDHFRIMAPDYLAQTLLPPVLGQLVNLAPGVQIDIENLSASGVQQMCEGHISLGFGVVNDGPVLENVASQALFQDRQVCLMRKGHPLAAKTLSLEDYAGATHALLSITGKGGGRIDDILNEHGLKRTIALRVAHFMTISAVIAPTDLIITVPEMLAAQVMTEDLELVAPPKELGMPHFSVSQIWHQRFTKDPAHQWLRRMIKSACLVQS
ncbi:DNA-binding transcriptional LysR family regulator [Roseibium hamelinense]|uniref:DNA-binding transcriptional LysR family regulator n=1 Tax=Roseibium hamelinense TaxID=150831 RepID=A0A562SF99_9HYPH|nr:LysR family transcriptional regulator [Roseibium hamelinense]TWI79952.1 DNA-binding transcriptional LysR family regulator [Roseibium hamelinense]